ncbi:MAG: OmpH family outer membrane protein [Bacteroidetes bacterium]|nr:OmpH family outer membrane protein [Bacteroidota bacterium]
MNKALLSLNIILLLAVAYLYYSFFQQKNTPVTTTKNQNLPQATFRVAYFDLDTLEKYYTFAKETRNYLKSKNDAMEAKLNGIRKQYQDKVNDYNRRGATLSQVEQSQMQEDLARLDNYYSQQQQSLSQNFQGEYMQKMLDLKNKIQSFLKDYSAKKGYEFVFASSSDDMIYYKDTLRNITPEIIDQLNASYKEAKK